MCGIFGAIGKSINTAAVRALAIANRERGNQSFGLFDSSGKAVKAGIDPYKALAHAEFAAFIGNTDKWFIAGHTRKATHGNVNDTNAHPFRFGRIIGAHNGIVRYPRDRNYQVDSEYLFDELDRCNGDYQTALADVDGYWGLSWFDGSHFYLQAHNNSVSIALADDSNWYYSSDVQHLAACIGSADKICTLDAGRTIRFNSATENPEMCADFVATSKTVWDRTSWRNGLGVTTAPAARSAPAAAGPRSWPPAARPSLAAAGRETKAQRKRRKRIERKAARAAELAADWPPACRASCDEFDAGNEMAQEAGYRDLGDFMYIEGITSETQAIRMLEDALWEGEDNSSQFDLWRSKNESTDIVELDSIPF